MVAPDPLHSITFRLRQFMRISRRKALVLFIILIVVWGINWTVVKLIVQEIPPIWSAAIRMLIAAAAALIAQCVSGQFIIPKRHDLSIILVIMLFNMVAGSVLMALGVQFVSVGRSVVLGYTTPLWVAPGAWFFLHESLARRQIIGVLIGLCGLMALFNPLALDWTNSHIVAGNIMLLSSAFSWAITILFIRSYVWHSTPFQLLFWQCLPAGLILTVMALSIEGPLSFTLTPSLAALLFYCGVPATALAYWAMAIINSSLPATTTSLSLLITPVVGIGGSLIFLGERIDPALVIAAALILTGIGLGAFPQKNKSAPA